MPAPTLAPAQLERLRQRVTALSGTTGPTLGVAVSGGPDSLALLLLSAQAFPGDVIAATVDHLLRPESADEAAWVAQVCGSIGVSHTVLRPEAPPAGNIQSEARSLRYRLLAAWARKHGVDFVLTAHHADDQAETLLMRLLRGAGLAGLAGIRPRTILFGTTVLRPLLGWRREELSTLVREAGFAAIADPSNGDERFDRARLRRMLSETQWLQPEALARSAAALADAEEAIEWIVRRLWTERVRDEADSLCLDPAGLPHELRRRLACAALTRIEPGAAPRGEEISRLLATLEAGGKATLAGIRCGGGPSWRFERAPPRRAG